jgi:hypothetical protein
VGDVIAHWWSESNETGGGVQQHWAKGYIRKVNRPKRCTAETTTTCSRY